ncbi:MAG: hypothetical protein COY53_07045 [Elusimicrobia bacterium CG_4_10_14_0_8_um_filter_37_32]|nr:MAG: hypothetical protein COY53_07045 [Elusimicrobia bacterium CG_4_10_14_0_8_um_filter_37_32]
MNGMTVFAKGLTALGQTHLKRKEQDLQLENSLFIEKMKQDAWQRKLQEQFQEHQALQNRMVAIEKERTKREETKNLIDYRNELLKQNREANKILLDVKSKQRELDIEEQKLQLQKEGKGYFAKNKSEQYISPKDREIDRILKKRDTLGVDALSEEEKTYLQNYFVKPQSAFDTYFIDQLKKISPQNTNDTNDTNDTDDPHGIFKALKIIPEK